MKPTSKPRLKASVFRKAAEIVAQRPNEGCCFALDYALMPAITDWDTSPHHLFLEAVLKPRYCSLGFWYHEPVEGVEPRLGDIQCARILGLLLCELLVKEGWSVSKGHCAAPSETRKTR